MQRRSLVRLLVWVVASFAATALAETSTREYNLQIASQPVQAALQEFSRQTGLNVSLVVTNEDQKSFVVAPLSGRYTLESALNAMLGSSRLVFKRVNEKTIAVIEKGSGRNRRTSEADQPSYLKRLAERWFPEGQTAKRAPAPSASTLTHAQIDSDVRDFEEVIVTAQKRTESLQDVPVPVTAVDARALSDTNQLRLKDYFSQVPGLALVQSGDTGQPIIAIRGLITGGQSNSTVGYVIDDVPYGATVNPGTLPYAPDIDPGDLARIEVLRGPQGTLYGASSLGGLLKLVTIDPSTEATRGRMQVGTTRIHGGSELGHSVRGSINVPLSDDLAVRASGFIREGPGYIDNVRSGQRDVNSTEASGGHLAALWTPSADFSLKLNALIQDVERKGSDDVTASLGGKLAQAVLKGTGTYERKSEAYSATMTAKLGDVEMISITGYSVDEIGLVSQGLPIFDQIAISVFGVSGSSASVPMDTRRLTQELRVSFEPGRRARWLIGAFYGDEEFDLRYAALANDPLTGVVAGRLFSVYQPVTFEEYAAFTNVTVDVTDGLDVQIGGRFSANRQKFSSARSGPLSRVFYGSDPSFVPEAAANDSAFTYLVTPRFKISRDLMVYVRLASGYRPGGANANCTNTFPCRYEADTTQNYDLGVKGNAFDGAVSFDASLYYIKWKDIQIPLNDPSSGHTFTDNAAEAKSQGAELSVQAKPLDGLKVSAWIAWNDAELEEALPATSATRGAAGDRLPYSSRLSGSLMLEREFTLWDTANGALGASVSYVDDRKGQFTAAGVKRATFPSYAQVDVHGNLQYGDWMLGVFVNNLTDRRGVLRSGSDFFRPDLITYIQPRTIGMQLEYQF